MDAKGPRSRRWFYLFAALLALGHGGCLWVAAGAAGGAALGYAYTQGRLSHTYSASFDDTWNAARVALKDLGMPITGEERQPGNGFLKSQTSDGDTVRVQIDAETSKFPNDGALTRVGVRVGAFGDHPASVRLLDLIGTRLTPAATLGTPATAPPNWTGAAPPPGATSAPPLLAPATTAPPPLAAEPVSRSAIPRR